MSDAATAALITSCGAIVLAIINLIASALTRRKEKKNGMQAQFTEFQNEIKELRGEVKRTEAKVDKLAEHNDLQYLSLLRLTVMDSDMPMSERLIAGKEYLNRGGNGDVKKFYENLEQSINE